MCNNNEAQASIAIAILYVDFLKYVKWLKTLADECSGERGSFSLECCDAHRYLRQLGGELRERGSELCPSIILEEGIAQVLSPAWWRKNGFCHHLGGEIEC